MSKVERFWCHEARNVRCVREADYDALTAGIREWWFGDYQPTPEAVEISRGRIGERLAAMGVAQ